MSDTNGRFLTLLWHLGDLRENVCGDRKVLCEVRALSDTSLENNISPKMFLYAFLNLLLTQKQIILLMLEELHNYITPMK